MGLQPKQPRGRAGPGQSGSPLFLPEWAPLCALSFLEGPTPTRGQHAGEVGGGAIQRPLE